MEACTIRIDHDLRAAEIGARSGLLWADGGFVLAGIGEARRLSLERPGGFPAVMSDLAELRGADEVAGPGSGPVGFGALPFDPDEPGEIVVPEVVVGQDEGGRRWLTVITEGGSRGGAVDRAIDAVGRRVDELLSAPPMTAQPVDFSLTMPVTPEFWRDRIVGEARDRIRSGGLDKVVLCRELVLRTDQPIDVAVVVDRLRSVFPAAYLFLVDGFVGASPELLVSRIDDVVRAHPLAGTAARSTDPATDQRQIGTLLASEKDRWEHRITIDWLLDNLLPFCSYVDAEPEPTIVTMANVHHLGTRVEGRLSAPAASVLELVAALHPTPALGGNPQKDALALIDELEPDPRGRYGGPVGWVDGAGNGSFAVGIRAAQMDGAEVRLRAGVGVVGDSDPEAELDETRAKFRAMLGALIQP